MEEEQINRILIIGAPGVGKTTLAEKLGRKYSNLQVIHLDKVHYIENFKLRDTNERDNMINELADKEQWIMDGTFIDTLDKRLQRADKIIFLDYSRWTAIKGIFARRTQDRDNTPKLNLSFINYVFNYNFTQRPRILEKLQSIDNSKLITFKKQSELNEWLKTL